MLIQELLSSSLVPGYAMLMSSNQNETAVHSCHYTGNLPVRIYFQGTGQTAEIHLPALTP